MEGIFGIYKEKGPTSNRVLTQLKKITNLKKIGHAGTLDPLAEGILVVGIGKKYTKQLEGAVKKEKEYIAEVKFGFNSTTDDQEGELEEVSFKTKPTLEDIQKIITKFVGNIEQVPPIFSAIKISGQEAYKLARKGKNIKMGSRQVEIKSIEILDYVWPILKIKVTTGPGVYIRSLARDIGASLSVGGYLYSLQRTRVGEFDVKSSLTLDQFKNKFNL